MDTSKSKQGGRRNLLLALLQRGKQILFGVVEANDHVTVPLGVGGPEYHHLVDLVLSLEGPGIRKNITSETSHFNKSCKRRVSIGYYYHYDH